MNPEQIPNKSETSLAAKKSSQIIDEAIIKLRTLLELEAKKGTLQELIISEVLRTKQLQSDQAAFDLARYLEDDLRMWNFSKDENTNEEIKRGALAYLKNFLHPDIPQKANDPETIEPPDFDTP